MASPDTIKPNYENASPVVATGPLPLYPLPPLTDQPVHTGDVTAAGGHLKVEVAFMGPSAAACFSRSSLSSITAEASGLHLSERCDEPSAVCLANKGPR